MHLTDGSSSRMEEDNENEEKQEDEVGLKKTNSRHFSSKHIFPCFGRKYSFFKTE